MQPRKIEQTHRTHTLGCQKAKDLFAKKVFLNKLYTFGDQGMATIPAMQFPSKLIEARSFGSSIYNIFHSNHLLEEVSNTIKIYRFY